LLNEHFDGAGYAIAALGPRRSPDVPRRRKRRAQGSLVPAKPALGVEAVPELTSRSSAPSGPVPGSEALARAIRINEFKTSLWVLRFAWPCWCRRQLEASALKTKSPDRGWESLRQGKSPLMHVSGVQGTGVQSLQG